MMKKFFCSSLMLSALSLGLAVSAAGADTWSYHQVQPDRCLSLHRAGVAGTLFRIQGFSKQVGDPQFNPRLDAHNRYQSYGAVMPDNVLPMDGWDWSRWPGTTSIYLVPEALSMELREPINGMSFAGGSQLDSRVGIFAMRFHDESFDRSFWFNKSVFAFGDKLICLGTDIENHDYQRETVTTLFQTALPDRQAPVYANSAEPVSDFPYVVDFAAEAPLWLVDPMGIGYVLPAGHQVRMTRQTQLSVSDLGDEEVSGDFASAWISHGTFPLGGSYAYTVLLQHSPEAIAAYAEAPAHEVVVQEKDRHIVRDAEAGLTGYVLFKRASLIEAGPVLSVNHPSLVITEEQGETLRISVCDPDLTPREAIATHAAPAHGAHGGGHGAAAVEDDRIAITLRGKWDFVDTAVPAHVERTELRPDHSTFAFDTVPGKPTEVLLKVRP